MLNKLLALIRKYEMLQPGDRVTCAVSGGADSMALLWAMYLLKEKLQIQLGTAHFNHGLRGEESDRDEAFVRQFCRDYQIPFQAAGGKVTAGKKGLEAAARDARYGFLKSFSGKVATAHTANDNAETVLMHLVRGTGLKGLGGIAPVNGKLIRPMLTVTRDDVLAFLDQYHIPYVTDSSNKTDAFLRNRLRHHVMPLLKQENPRLAQNLSAMAMDLREDEQALCRKLPEVISVHWLQELSGAERSRALGAFLERCGVREPEREHIALMEQLVFSRNPSAKADFPGGITVQRNYDTLELCQQTGAIKAVLLPCPGQLLLPEYGLKVTCCPAETCMADKNCFTVAAKGQILLRSRQTGDSMRLTGGTKSLKKLFIDRKIPASQRMTIPVVADDEGVLGVYGFGANRDRLAQSLPGTEIRFETL